MWKFLIVAVAGLTLAGCQTVKQDRALTGAVVGGAAGALVGGLASNTVGGVVAGGVIGAAAGGLIGAATAPDRCYVRKRSGQLRRVAC